MAFDVEGARAAGYSDAEIADHLGKAKGFNVAGARKSGYSDADILSHLGVPVAQPTSTAPAAPAAPAKPKAPIVDNLNAETLNPTGSTLENVAAGAGKAVADLWRGMKQIGTKAGNAVGVVSDATRDRVQADIDEAAKRDAALMDTGGGITGNVAGNVATMLLPGAALKTAGGLVARLPNAARAAEALVTAGKALNAPTTFKGAAAGGAALGALGPVTSEEGELGRLKNVAAGGAGGTVGLGAGRVASAAYQGGKALVEPFTKGGQESIIGRTLQRFVDDPAAVAAKLKTAAEPAVGPFQPGQVRATMGEIVPGSVPTTAEASGSTALATLTEALKSANPQVKERFANVGTAQNAARIDALKTIAGTPEDLAAAVTTRADATEPLREAALREANYGSTKTRTLADRLREKAASIVSILRDKGRFDTFAGQQDSLANSVAAVPGMPRGAGRYSLNADRAAEGVGAATDAAGIEAQRKAERAFLERQLASLQQSGYSPLQVSGITGQIDSTINRPGLRASDVVQKTLGDLRTKLASFADEAGNIDARDLYTIRKEIGNTIATHAKESGNWDKRLAASLERDLQGSIDAAIEKAGAGPLWQEYLTKYRELSGPIDRMKIGQTLMDRATSALKDSADNPKLRGESFARALRADDDLVRDATGFGQAKGLDSVLTPRENATIANVLADVQRSTNAANAARSNGSNTAQNLSSMNLLRQILGPLGLPESFAEARVLPTFFHRPATLLMKAQDQVIQDELGRALMNPGFAAQLLEKVQRQAVPGRLSRNVQPLLAPAGTATGLALVPDAQ